MGNRIFVSGLGFAHPETFVTTEEVCAHIGVPDKAEDFVRRFRMHERPLWWDPTTHAPRQVDWPGTTLAIDAGRQALAMAGVHPEDVTHIFYISCTPDRNHFQADVFRIMEQLGLVKASCLQFDLGCGGIAPALLLASQLLAAGAARHVLITTGNSTSPFMVRREQYRETKEWFSLAMFNDSGGAMLLSAIPDDRVGTPVALRKTGPHAPHWLGVQNPPGRDFFVHSFIADDTAGANGSLLAALSMETGIEPLMHVHGGGANDPVSPDVLYRLHGQSVGTWYGPVMLETIERFNWLLPNIFHPTRAALVAVHQANGNVVEQLRNALRLGGDDTRLPIRTWHLGNSVSASTIEVLLDAVKNKRLKDGDIVAIATIGAGMSTGGAIFRWGSP